MPLYNSMVMLFGYMGMAHHLRQLGVNKNMWKLVALDEERETSISSRSLHVQTQESMRSIRTPRKAAPWVVIGTSSGPTATTTVTNPSFQSSVALTHSASLATGTEWLSTPRRSVATPSVGQQQQQQQQGDGAGVADDDTAVAQGQLRRGMTAEW